MPPATYDEQLQRELQRLQLRSRLIHAPTLHLWDIGRRKRRLHQGLEAALLAFHHEEGSGVPLSRAEARAAQTVHALFSDPAVNAYTPEMNEDDARVLNTAPFDVKAYWDGDTLTLHDPDAITAQLKRFFHPLRWPDLNRFTLWDLLKEVLPAMDAARVTLRLYETQRWLYDEHSQRCAETLTARLQSGVSLPTTLNVDAAQQALFSEYHRRLLNGTNARRWMQEQTKEHTRGQTRKQGNDQGITRRNNRN